MIRISALIICCCISMILSASEKPKKDIYTVDQLDKEVRNARHAYDQQRKNNSQAWHNFLSRGNRINHGPNPHSSGLNDQKK